jgi:serine phosphatase RsbU (regulator of sigma subunit)
MKPALLDDLVLLPEGEALQRHFDAGNWRVFRWVLPFTLILSLMGVAGTLDDAKPLAFILYLADIALTIAVFGSRKEPWFEKHYRRIQTAYLALQMVAWSPATFNIEGRQPHAAGLLRFILLFLRLRPGDALLLYGGCWIVQCLPISVLGLGGRDDFDAGGTVLTVLLLAANLAWTRLAKRRFLVQWRREQHKARERLRMRDEIAYARKIQLSMLPQGSPALDWLDLAAVSTPATEVGGDYYDYFRLSPSRVALVIGDVSGHGLASGLLLSGVRSCLYLLEDQLASPVRVLERLSPMVRRTTNRRMYITLLIAVLDREAGTLSVASAGHVPVLRRAAGADGFDEVGRGAPPLGTFRDARFEGEARPLAPGDLLVLYTDGLVEARDAAGELYGDERLQRAVARAGKGARAAEIRDSVLADFALFRGEAEPDDDVTLVVARVR